MKNKHLIFLFILVIGLVMIISLKYCSVKNKNIVRQEKPPIKEINQIDNNTKKSENKELDNTTVKNDNISIVEISQKWGVQKPISYIISPQTKENKYIINLDEIGIGPSYRALKKPVIGCTNNNVKRTYSEKNPKRKNFHWEETYKKLKQEKVVALNFKNEHEEAKSQKSQTSPDNESTRFKYRVEKYAFVDGHIVWGMKDKDCCCRRRGYELIGKLGLRLKLKLADKLGLWGDLSISAGHQSYIHSSRTKFWFDINNLFLSTKDPFEPYYPGFELQIGRIPISETRGFWYRKSLDSIRIKYQSTLLKGFALFGTRFNDSKITSSEERSNIKDYFYFVGNLRYQYHYNHYIELFLLKEYKNKSEHIGDVKSVWNSVKPDKNLNWIGLRLIGNKNLKYETSKNKLSYWGDLAYMWGKNQFVDLKSLDCCRAYKTIEGFNEENENGWAGEIGASYKKKVWGIGGRLAIAQGGDGNTFFQPRTSNNKDRLFGPNTVRIYGELSNPDLSNLILIGLFGGYEISEKNWIELNLLKYFQYEKSTHTTFSKYLLSPNGKNTDLGFEVDLIFEGEKKTENAKWRYNITAAYFQGGGAYNGITDINHGFGLFFRVKRYW